MKENKDYVHGSHNGNFKYAPSVGAVYIIYHDITGHYYIGQTSDIGRRLSHHFGSLARGTHECYRLQEVYNKSNYADFSFEYEEISDSEQRKLREDTLLKSAQSDPLLMNTADYKGTFVSERNAELTAQWKEKLSIMASTRTGDANPFYRKKHTAETIKKISEAHKGTTNEAQALPVAINGVAYRSLTDASKQLEVHVTTIRHRVVSSKPIFCNYYYLTYEDTPYIVDPTMLFPPDVKSPVIFEIEGERFYTMEAIYSALGTKTTTVYYRCNSKHFPNWKKLS